MFLLILMFLLTTSLETRAQSIETQVDSILATAQTRSGQIVDLLIQLGPPAVPILLQRLDTYPFPMVIVQALGRIGDHRATPALLNLLDKKEPLAAAGGGFQGERSLVITALRGIGDSSAEPQLAALFSNPNVFIGTRLSAATALARLGSPGTKARARDFILQLVRDVDAGTYGSLHTSGPFALAELDEGLFEVGTEESLAILMNRLMQSQIADEELTIINLLAKTPSPAVAAALLAFCEKRNAEPYVQLQAAKTLVGLGVAYPRDRLLTALRNLGNHLPPEFRADADKLLAQILALP